MELIHATLAAGELAAGEFSPVRGRPGSVYAGEECQGVQGPFCEKNREWEGVFVKF